MMWRIAGEQAAGQSAAVGAWRYLWQLDGRGWGMRDTDGQTDRQTDGLHRKDMIVDDAFDLSPLPPMHVLHPFLPVPDVYVSYPSNSEPPSRSRQCVPDSVPDSVTISRRRERSERSVGWGAKRARA